VSELQESLLGHAEKDWTKIAMTSILQSLSLDENVPPLNLAEYYTDPAVASFLVRWAVTPKMRRVLDPGCGDGVFLCAVAQLVKQRSKENKLELIGIELSPSALSQARENNGESHHVKLRMLRRNFFEVSKRDLGPVDAVVGNPPFIRHHGFKGRQLETALERCLEAGVDLPRTASSWAHFVIHGCSMLRPGGRLALVLPEELLVAEYSRVVWRFLRRQFERILVLSANSSIFHSVEQRTVLLLGDNAARGPATVNIGRFSGLGSIGRIKIESLWLRSRVLPVAEIIDKNKRASDYLVHSEILNLYRKLARRVGIARLSSFGSIRIGYVTGDNDFFILTKDEIERWSIPHDFLLPTVSKAREISGTYFTLAEWSARFSSGDARALLRISATPWESLPSEVRTYLEFGKSQGVTNRYHCRSREPWYSVRNVRAGDLILKSLAVGPPLLAWNPDSVSVSNSLNQVFINSQADSLLPQEVAVASLTSLTYLSTKIEGHRLSGGLWKLEPREASRIAIVYPEDESIRKELRALRTPLQRWLGNGQWSYAMEKIDELLLDGYLGLPRSNRKALVRGFNRIERRA